MSNRINRVNLVHIEYVQRFSRLKTLNESAKTWTQASVISLPFLIRALPRSITMTALPQL
jgi:hypothetical protein